MVAASWTMGSGNSSRSSHSWAAGRTTFSAKSWIHFWIWSWSSLRAREKSAMGAPLRRRGTGKLPGGNPFTHTGPDSCRDRHGDDGEGGTGDVRRPEGDVPEEERPEDRADHPGQRRGRLLEPEHRASPV